MGDSISFSLFTEPFKAMVDDTKLATDKATMYALRATGRYIAKVAKASAPVYSGPDPRATEESGNLKKSIANARGLASVGGGAYELKVGPFGSSKKDTATKRHGKSKGQVRGVQLYRAQMEVQYGYMAAGMNAVGPASQAI